MEFERPNKVADLLGKSFECACGQTHRVNVDQIEIGGGTLALLPAMMKKLNITAPFIVCDHKTKNIAVDHVLPLVQKAAEDYRLFEIKGEEIEPDEKTIGQIVMAYDNQCDGIIAVGSGVINDCCKIVAHASKAPYMIVATAPSMDGYVSDTSSMVSAGVKVSLPAPAARGIIADTDIFKKAPEVLLQAGLGDMLAKYTAIAEWRLANLIIGEYYCPHIAQLVRYSLQKCVSHAPKLLMQDEDAANGVMEGLVLSGIAMSFAKCSRPASGLEHYFSHMWEMMALDRGEKSELHGVQVGIGTYLTLLLFEDLLQERPDFKKAVQRMDAFKQEEWEEEMKVIFGKASQAIIQNEKEKYHKNDRTLWEKRIKIIEENWETFERIVKEELPSAQELKKLMDDLHMAVLPKDIGIGREDVKKALIGSRDIRDKYLLSSILWDLGLLHEKAEELAERVK